MIIWIPKDVANFHYENNKLTIWLKNEQMLTGKITTSVFCRFCHAMKLPIPDQATNRERKLGQEWAELQISTIEFVKLIHKEKDGEMIFH